MTGTQQMPSPQKSAWWYTIMLEQCGLLETPCELRPSLLAFWHSRLFSPAEMGSGVGGELAWGGRGWVSLSSLAELTL